MINKIRTRIIEYFINKSPNLFFTYQYSINGDIDVYLLNQIKINGLEKDSGLKEILKKLFLKLWLIFYSGIREDKRLKFIKIKTIKSICLDIIESNVEGFGVDVFKIKYLLSIEYSDIKFEKKLFKLTPDEKRRSYYFWESVELKALTLIEKSLIAFVPKKIKEKIKQKMFKKNYKMELMERFRSSPFSEDFEETSVRKFLEEKYFDCKNGVWICKNDPFLIYIESNSFALSKPGKKFSNSLPTSSQIKSIISYWTYSSFKQRLSPSRLTHFPEY